MNSALDLVVTGETCLHYLAAGQDDVLHLGTHAKINPPLRTREEVENPWQALAAGRLDAVTSDHAPWTAEVKGRDDLFDAPSGAPGVEVLLPLFHDAARRREMELAVALRLLTEGPTRCYGLYPRKCRLGLFAEADLVAYDPDAEGVVEAATHRSISGWSPYQGRCYRGRVVTTVVGGIAVYDEDEITAQAGSGRFAQPRAR
jgi:allantoinase